MGRDDLPAILHRLERWRETHKNRGVLYRVIWVLSGFVVLLTGLAMTVLPGPAVVVIPLGLAMLSLEFVWAERLLHTSVRRGMSAKQRLRLGRAAALAAGLVGAAAAATLAFLLFA
ncbi:MAG: PGPGW domain-containing protein [Gaiellaceae bacterium]